MNRCLGERANILGGAIVALAWSLAAHGQECTPLWSADFRPAFNGYGYSSAVFDDGSGPALYVGGVITSAGAGAASNVVRFDGKEWTSVGSGIPGTVYAMLDFDNGVDGPKLYAGAVTELQYEEYQTAFYRWDGTSWTQFGGAIDGYLTSVTSFDDHSGSGTALFAGGEFPSSDGLSSNWLLKWNGKSWGPVASSATGEALALAAYDDGSGGGVELYAAGEFPINGALSAHRIAKWNGTAWTDLATTNDAIGALMPWNDGIAGNGLYVGGAFSTLNGASFKSLALWNGTTWAQVGGGLPLTLPVKSLASSGGPAGPTLYVGGLFDKSVYRLDSNGWTALSDWMGNTFNIRWFDGTGTPGLFAFGVIPSGAALWDGSKWIFQGHGCTGANIVLSCCGYIDQGCVNALIYHDDGSGSALYAGGNFFAAGSVAASRIAKWDGRNWSALGAGLPTSPSNQVNALASFDDGQAGGPKLFAGGHFSSAGGVTCQNIARWGSSTWSNCGNVVGLRVYSMLPANLGSTSSLYVAGTFSSAGGIQASNIARFTGTQWLALGPGLNSDVYVLAVFDDGSGPALYAGGAFTAAGSTPVNHIAKWNGTSWSAVGQGVNGNVSALAVYDAGDGHGSALYAGGGFTSAGGVAAAHLAKWNGTSWSEVGGGVGEYGTPNVLRSVNDGFDDRPGLYVGGTFSWAGGLQANGIARWNGAVWTPLEIGVQPGNTYNAGVFTLMDTTDSNGTPTIIAGGRFQSAGSAPSMNIAEWHGCPIDVLPKFPTCRYEFTPVQAFGANPFVRGLTESMQTVGRIGGPPFTFFLWSNGSALSIPLPQGAQDPIPVDLNNAGTIVANMGGNGAKRGYVRSGGIWTVIDPIPGGAQSFVTAINEIGQVAGYRNSPTETLGFTWQNGVLTDLDAPDSAFTQLTDINDAGAVVGFSLPDGALDDPKAFVWSAGQFTDLPLLAGAYASKAQAMNNRFTIVGAQRMGPQSDDPWHACMWKNGTVTDLGTLDEFLSSFANDVNSTDEIVGYLQAPSGYLARAVNWNAGDMTILDDVVPADVFEDVVSSLSINDVGQILVSYSGYSFHAVLTPATPGPTDINGDCRTNTGDLLVVIYEWGETDSPADVNDDGIVNAGDLLEIVNHWSL